MKHWDIKKQTSGGAHLMCYKLRYEIQLHVWFDYIRRCSRAGWKENQIRNLKSRERQAPWPELLMSFTLCLPWMWVRSPPHVSVPSFTNHSFLRRLFGSHETQNIRVKLVVKFNSVLFPFTYYLQQLKKNTE